MEREEDENLSISEVISPSSSHQQMKKVQKLTSVTRTIQFLNIFNKKPPTNMVLNENSNRMSVSNQPESGNSAGRGSISTLKSLGKNKSSMFQNPNASLKKINEYLNVGDLENSDLYFQSGRFKYIVSRILRVGSGFGEIGQKNNLRVETIVCNEDCHFAVMSKADYREILFEIEKIKRNQDLEFVSKTFLKDAPFISKDNLLSFLYNFDKRKFPGGTVIYDAGDHPQECFLIKKGEVEVSY